MSTENKPRTGIWALCAKLGTKLFGIFAKLLKALKVSKVGLAAISFAGYSAILSWKFALLLMIAVGFHESGHVWAMKKMGIKTKGFYFLPFIGGAAIAEEEYDTYGQNAYIAIMGPIWGAGLAWVCGILYFVTGMPLFAAAAAWMATINLFNLLPVTPLDGGQLINSIAFSIHKFIGVVFMFFSMGLAVYFLFTLKIGLFALLLIVGGLEAIFEVWRRFKLRAYNNGLINKWELPKSFLKEDGSIRQFPKEMNLKQLCLATGSMVGTTIILIVLLFLMKHVPGADIASNFLQ